MRATFSILFVLALAGCTDRTYVYTPQSANAYAAGIPAARTPIPEEQPHGSMQITSHGITQLQQGDTKIPALHVRMEVANDSDDQPWIVDTRLQVLGVSNLGLSMPIFVNADVKTLPLVHVNPGERRTIDLFFQLPVTITRPDEVPAFEMHWQVGTPRRIMAASNTFARLERIEPGPEVSGFYDPGYRYWWHAPYHARAAFVDTQPVIVRMKRAPVHVHRYSGYYRPAGHVAWL